MQVIVSDSSALIDLAKAELMAAVISLPYEFRVPDVLLNDELIDLGSYRVRDLLKAGLTVGHLDGDGVARVMAFSVRYPALSTNDCFALALAQIEGDALLTGDQNLRKAAQLEHVVVHGVLWLCDLLLEHGAVSKATLRIVLEEWDADPLVWLPRDELQSRIRMLR